MAIPVDEVKEVTAARCISCLSCVEVCPTKKQGALTWGPAGGRKRAWPQTVLVAVILLSVTAAVVAAYVFPIASFIKSRGEEPAAIAAVELRIEHLTCRGKGNLFWYYLERDDFLAIPGYVKLEAWPGPALADVRISYDPTLADEQAIKDAIVEPYFDAVANRWRPSPFVVEGYDPLALPDP